MSERELPQGWAWATLGELASRRGTLDPTKHVDKWFELWSVPAYPTGAPETVCGAAIGSTKQRVNPNDVLLCKINPRINRVWKVGPKKEAEQIASTEWIVLEPPGDGQFLQYILTSPEFRERLCADVSGVGGSLTRARPGEALRLVVAIAPLAEQRRIVAKLDELLARSRRARGALAEVPALLARYRESVLAAAFRGDLTAGWREANPQEESASAQQSTRQAALSEAESSEGPWPIAQLQELVERGTVITYGIVLPGDEIKGGVPYVRQQDVEDGWIDTAKLRHTTREIADKHSRSQLAAGDVLLCIIRYLRVAIVPAPLDGANITQGMVRIRCEHSVAEPTYVAWFLRGPWAQTWMKGRYFGMAMPRINVADARSIPVPVPPLAEQHEIVRRIEAAFARIDAIEAVVAEQRARLDAYDRSLLARAFAGELVPQDPNDEPASVMLARLRAERGESAGGRGRRRRA